MFDTSLHTHYWKKGGIVGVVIHTVIFATTYVVFGVAVFSCGMAGYCPVFDDNVWSRALSLGNLYLHPFEAILSGGVGGMFAWLLITLLPYSVVSFAIGAGVGFLYGKFKSQSR